LTDPHVLYSATTRLAYSIAEQFYGGVHYVWCAPYRRPDPFAVGIPASSNPLEIYWSYHKAVKSGDGHSFYIAANRRGIAFGATARHQTGIVDAKTRDRIQLIAEKAPITDFKPLLFVIPYALVKNVLKEAAVDEAARASSVEYIIENLQRSDFDVLDLSEGGL
jgi:hypothetical protein